MVWDFFKTTAYFVLILLLLILGEDYLLAQSTSSIIINEFLYNPIGTDTGNEWIELYNPGEIEVDLEGWAVEVAGTTFKEVITLTGVSIEPQSYFLICGDQVADSCDVTVPKIGMQNGGTASDGVRLLNELEEIVDVVIYDLPNTNNLQNESGEIVEEEETSVTSQSGESLGRTNHVDTDNNRGDFTSYESPTPGESNSVEPIEEEIVTEEVLGESDEPELLEETGYNHVLVSIIVLIIISFILYRYSDILFALVI